MANDLALSGGLEITTTANLTARPSAAAARKWLNKWQDVFSGSDYQISERLRQTLGVQLMSLNAMSCFVERERPPSEIHFHKRDAHIYEKYQTYSYVFTSMVIALDFISQGSKEVHMHDIMVELPYENSSHAYGYFSQFYSLYPKGSPERELISAAWADYYTLCTNPAAFTARKPIPVMELEEVPFIRKLVNYINKELQEALDDLSKNPAWAYYAIRNNINMVAKAVGLWFGEFETAQKDGSTIIAVKGIDKTSANEISGLEAIAGAISGVINNNRGEGAFIDVNNELPVAVLVIPNCSDKDLVTLKAYEAQKLAAEIYEEVGPELWTAVIKDRDGISIADSTQFKLM